METMEAQKSILLKNISEKKEELIKLAALQGLSSKETVECSHELDILLNTYQSNF